MSGKVENRRLLGGGSWKRPLLGALVGALIAGCAPSPTERLMEEIHGLSLPAGSCWQRARILAIAVDNRDGFVLCLQRGNERHAVYLLNGTVYDPERSVAAPLSWYEDRGWEPCLCPGERGRGDGIRSDGPLCGVRR